MKKHILYLFAVVVIAAASCKGKTMDNSGDTTAADSGQAHIGNQNPADSNKLNTTPTETGGKDSSGNGSGTTNAPKDTLKQNP